LIASAPPDLPRAEFATPLQARDALDSLDIFGTCTNPYKTGFQDFNREVTAVVCYVLDQDQQWSGVHVKRNVTVVVPRENWDAFVIHACNYWPVTWRVVSDGRSFLTLAYLDEGRLDDNYPGQWPDEVWPEDVQRVLGGGVTTVSDLCGMVRDSQ